MGLFFAVVITLLRGLIIGVTYFEVIDASTTTAILALGTAVLELGAYVFSGAAGINIGLAILFPRRYGIDSRWEAFFEAWRDAGGL